MPGDAGGLALPPAGPLPHGHESGGVDGLAGWLRPVTGARSIGVSLDGPGFDGRRVGAVRFPGHRAFEIDFEVSTVWGGACCGMWTTQSLPGDPDMA